MEPTDPPRKHYGLKAREFDRVNTPGKMPEKSTEHDIYTILQQNRAIEQQNGKDNVGIKPVKSRRNRDYWMLMVGGNLLIAGLVAVSRFNPISLIFGLAGAVILSLSLTWVMWFVMSDY